jgi:penicillin-insensitive murein endopeptidase
MKLSHRLVLAFTSIFALGVLGAITAPSAEAKAKTAAKRPVKKKSVKKSAKKKPTKKSKKKKGKKRRGPSWPIPVPALVETQAVGIPSHGRLYHPTAAPQDGSTMASRPATRTRPTNFGTSALVDTLQFGADAVAAKDAKARLYLGDLSDIDGGQLTTHKSHQSGLDADISFYTRNDAGELWQDGQFVKLNSRGTNGGRSLDADLNWTFVEALLTSPHAQVQYIFIYNPLKQLILEAGRKANANPELLKRAEYVMQQPRDSSPHADHYHVRIYCPADDLGDGCMTYGIIWPWVEGITPSAMAPLASYATGGKLLTAWAVDGTSLSDCEEDDDPAESGAPMDGDYLCVDPALYEGEFIDEGVDEHEGTPLDPSVPSEGGPDGD